MLRAKMKESRVTNSYVLLAGHNRDPENFHFRIVTGGFTTTRTIQKVSESQ